MTAGVPGRRMREKEFAVAVDHLLVVEPDVRHGELHHCLVVLQRQVPDEGGQVWSAGRLEQFGLSREARAGGIEGSYARRFAGSEVDRDAVVALPGDRERE